MPPQLRVYVLLVVSYGFYAAIALPFILVLGYVTLVSFSGARLLARRPSAWLLWTFVVLGLLPLVLLKVLPTESAQLFGAMQNASALSRAVVPIGVSFYSLQAISALIDVYRGGSRPAPTFAVHALYMAFFPLLLAGPIERQGDLVPQLVRLRKPKSVDIYFGSKTALWGYFCKLVVADSIGTLVDRVFVAPEAAAPIAIVTALVLYSFQIYFDFYGYSLIALGIGRSFGVQLTPNFAQPYLARTLRDFWRRWHISLSTWLRDYVYAPLGGRKNGSIRLAVAVLATFMASALWHGIGSNFVLWGVFHAVAFLVLDPILRYLPNLVVRRPKWIRRLAEGVRGLICFLAVTLGWLFFRVSDTEHIRMLLVRMVTWGSPTVTKAAGLIEANAIAFVGALVIAIVVDATGASSRMMNSFPHSRRDMGLELAVVNVAALGLILFGDLGSRGFIYFQF